MHFFSSNRCAARHRVVGRDVFIDASGLIDGELPERGVRRSADTRVVNTSGRDEKAWLDGRSYQKSCPATIEERCRRDRTRTDGASEEALRSANIWRIRTF